MKTLYSFALLLICLGNVSALPNFIPSLLRGPYLQAATPVSIVIRWRTDELSDSKVSFGPAANNLNKTVSDNALVTDHEIKLTGLSPKTRYYYSIQSSVVILQSGNNNYFETPPPAGTAGKYRIGVLGDCGNNSVNQLNSRNQLISYLGNNYMNAFILLGDNAYANGTDVEYQANFFNIYKDNFLKKSPLYPSPGNHDYADNATRQNDHNIDYYDNFTMPKQGEAGGVASGTESYYSFDYGNIHFLSLDSYGKEDNSTRLYDTLGKQVTWIKQDLAANTNKDWIVAYWHHPPYTKGSHNSDTESQLVKIRENFIRILERYGVDLILCGHSHDYERSKLMKGHYGTENTFNAQVHNLSNSTGKYDGIGESCPYVKSTIKKQGTVYVVAGSAGQLGGMQAGYPHDGLPFSDATNGGAMLLEVEGNRLDAKWICADGVIRDQFTMEKNVNQRTSINMVAGSSTILNASFIGSYNWNTGAQTKSIQVSPSVDTDYIVRDNLNCIADTFNVKVSPALPVKLISFNGVADESNVVNLNWETTFEERSSFFALERSLDGRVFREVSQIPAIGNASSNQHYTFADTTSTNLHSQTLYYRLKQVDQDGSYEYSRMISVRLNVLLSSFDVKLVPNPSYGNDFTIEVTKGKNLQGKLAIYTAAGMTLHEEDFVLMNSKHLTFPNKLPSGIFLVKISVEGEVITKRLVVE
ncbi:metallophosphoesterase [Dyadobacter arcticus]|uniref:Por secretion system C-terminal sorting domain-containing protein n=1 Tax=Dyadobacter arcticus TaxID=1078754 RepID=A0ABX0USN3_9BACT|nr:metallophosphoesterase [Dyadobacter arcticus]NIJ53991.1 hypothetical protein [Dyadobacter arcticus]